MDCIQITNRILEIKDKFFMSDSGLANAMGITVGTVRKNKMLNLETHKFNQKNLEDLITYIKTEAGKL